MLLPFVQETDDRNGMIVQGEGRDGPEVTIPLWELRLAREFTDLLNYRTSFSPEQLADACEDNMEKIVQIAPAHQMAYVEECFVKLQAVCGLQEVGPTTEKLMQELAISIIESADNFRLLLQRLEEQYQILQSSGGLYESESEIEVAKDWFRLGSMLICHLALATRSQYFSIHSRRLNLDGNLQKGSQDLVAWCDLAKIIEEVRPSFLNVPSFGLTEAELQRNAYQFVELPKCVKRGDPIVCAIQELVYIRLVGRLEQEFGVLDLLAFLHLDEQQAEVSDLISTSGLLTKDYALFKDHPEHYSAFPDNKIARLVFVPERDQSARNMDLIRAAQQARKFINERSRVWLGDSA